MKRYSLSFLVFTFALLLSSCAGAARSGEHGSPVRTNRDIITQEELADHSNAYDAISALRPTWLRPRGTDSFNNPSQVWVYRDESRIGGVEALRRMFTADIGEIRFYDALAAQQRWGIGHGAGVILITSRLR